MHNGFSISLDQSNIHIQSFLSEDYDNLHLKTLNLEFLLEGVLLNKKKLLQEYALSDYETLIAELYARRKQDMVKEFEGEFRGFIFDKTENRLFVFTNATATQRVFYKEFEGHLYVDTSLVRLSETLKKNRISTRPDTDALYQLLCFGNLTEDKTPLENVFKLLDGHYLEIEPATLKISQTEYFNVNRSTVFIRSKNEALDTLHEIFSDSVVLEYEKDTELGCHHLALLSGGLDSRLAVMYAMKSGLKPDNVLCFSQSGYFDHTISEKIAKDAHLHYEFIPLDGGEFLKKIDDLTRISEGMGVYTGGIHVKHAVENLKYQNFGLFHSGQIGDGILGGFLTAPETKKPGYFKIVEDTYFLPKIKAGLDTVLRKYETEETFLLRNIAFNRTVLGAHVFQEKRYQTSPFMTKDFLQFSLSLPAEWKFNHRFYLEWIKKHCPEATKYRWERTLMKPDAKWKTAFGDQFVKRSFKLVHEKILKTPQNASMYPYQYYFDEGKDIQQVYQTYFEENIFRAEFYPELAEDLRKLFSSDRFYSKAKALNILAVLKLFF